MAARIIRGGLVRVFTIAKFMTARQANRDMSGDDIRLKRRRVRSRQPGMNRLVIIASMGEGLNSQFTAQSKVGLAGDADGADDAGIIRWIANRCHPQEILGRRAKQGHAANVNLLQRRRQADIGLLDSFAKGVQVADHQADRGKAKLGKLLPIFGAVAGKDAAVDGRMQGLDAPAQHFGLSSDLGDACHR